LSLSAIRAGESHVAPPERFQKHKLVWIARNSHIGPWALVDIFFYLSDTEHMLGLSSSSAPMAHVDDVVSKIEACLAALLSRASERGSTSDVFVSMIVSFE
jgi:hypothetical protein